MWRQQGLGDDATGLCRSLQRSGEAQRSARLMHLEVHRGSGAGVGGCATGGEGGHSCLVELHEAAVKDDAAKASALACLASVQLQMGNYDVGSLFLANERSLR